MRAVFSSRKNRRPQSPAQYPPGDDKHRLVDTFIHAVYLTDDSAFVQFNISYPVNDKSTTLESVVLDLLHGNPDENIDVPTSKIMGFDHVALGGADGSRTRVRKEIG